MVHESNHQPRMILPWRTPSAEGNSTSDPCSQHIIKRLPLSIALTDETPSLCLHVYSEPFYFKTISVLLRKRTDRTEKSPWCDISVIKAAEYGYVGFFQKPCLQEDCTQRRYSVTYTQRWSGLVWRSQKEKVTHMAIDGISKNGVPGTSLHLPCFFFL